MNKIIDKLTRQFMAVVGPSESGKTELIFKILKGRSFFPNLEEYYFFTKIINLFLGTS